MIRFTPILLCGIVALSAGPSAAFAQSYPGSSCLTNNEKVVRNGSEFINTDTANDHLVACPIGFKYDPLNPVLQGATVVVVDDNPSVDLTCTLASRNAKGGIVDSDQVNATGSDSNKQSFTFADLDLVAGGHLTLYCNVPPEWNGQRSSIVSYSIP